MLEWCYNHHRAYLWLFTVKPWGNATQFISRNLDFSSLCYSFPSLAACHLEFSKKKKKDWLANFLHMLSIRTTQVQILKASLPDVVSFVSSFLLVRTVLRKPSVIPASEYWSLVCGLIMKLLLSAVLGSFMWTSNMDINYIHTGWFCSSRFMFNPC